METKYSVADIVVHHHLGIDDYFLIEQIKHEMVDKHLINVLYSFLCLKTGMVTDYNAVTIDNIVSVEKVA